MRGQCRISGIAWRCIEAAAGLLTPLEREVVLGDLAETDLGACRGLADVFGLVVRRQLQVLTGWRPWAAVFGLTVPGSLLLMGYSVSVSSIYESVIAHKILLGATPVMDEPFIQLLWRGLLLIGGSWICGFVVGTMARRTLWLSVVSSCFPCLFCLARFREPSLSRFCLFIFLLPAFSGVRHALQSIRINLVLTLILAIATTALAILPINSRGMWGLNWSLIWPAWYIVAMACHRQKPWDMFAR